MVAVVIFAVSGFGLFFIYGGYLILLAEAGLVINLLRGKVSWNFKGCHGTGGTRPKISVYIAACDEEDVIYSRLENVVDTTYPLDRLQLIVISDGSRDGTADAARRFGKDHPEIDCIVREYAVNRGKAAIQNEAALLASATILVSTDAETVFNRDTLSNLIQPLADPKVGIVGGVVEYSATESNSIGRYYNSYRRMERRIRELETRLGILVKVDAPCVAYRKSIWTPIEDYEDVDQVAVLFAKKQGMRAVQAEYATCLDRANSTTRQEWRQRSRMTRKALLSTCNRWKVRDAIRYPIFTCALVLHKLLRFFSPVFCLLFIGSGVWLFRDVSLYAILCVLLAMLAQPVRSRLWVFALAQVGFLMGIWHWQRGVTSGAYRPTRTIT